MVDYCIYAWDSSSIFDLEHDNFTKSDTYVKFYRDARKIEEELWASGKPTTNLFRIVSIHWDEDLRRALEDWKILQYLDQNKKCGEKKPDWIIRSLQDKYLVDSKNKIKLLYIITDGEISNVSLEKFIEFDEHRRFETVVFHALNKDPKKIDLSAAASFSTSRRIVYCTSELCNSADISKKFDYDKINADNFSAEKDQLKSYIKLKFINKSIPDTDVWQEIKELAMLRDRLRREMILNSVEYICSPAYLEATETNLPTPKTDFPDLSKLLEVTLPKWNVVNETFTAILEYIKNTKNSYSFDALKFDTKVDKPVAEETMDDADSADEDADSTDNDAESLDDGADPIDDDADSMDDDAESLDDDADSIDDDADSMDDDAESLDDDADSMDDDADNKHRKEQKFFKTLLKHKGGVSIFHEYMDIMHG
uniref:Uncharacterized protein n=1 Tax=Glyptapanteles indiensis TaxID=92994 RepID=B7S8V5_GLYIN|nr:conserved hypothetical protein [Glyptapanteles indiensis]